MFKPFLTQFFTTFFLLFIVSLAVAEETAHQTKEFKELTSLLTSFERYQAEFDQKSYDKDKTEIQALTGTIMLQKPDHFYWKSDEPYAQLLVSDGKNIWHYDADLEQVVVQEYAGQVSQAPILVVLEDPSILAKTYNIENTGTNNEVRSFWLSALDENATLKDIKLLFADGKLTGLNFTDSLQQNTVIVFNDVQLNKHIEPSMFEFIIPPGVDVLHD